MLNHFLDLLDLLCPWVFLVSQRNPEYVPMKRSLWHEICGVLVVAGRSDLISKAHGSSFDLGDHVNVSVTRSFYSESLEGLVTSIRSGDVGNAFVLLNGKPKIVFGNFRLNTRPVPMGLKRAFSKWLTKMESNPNARKAEFDRIRKKLSITARWKKTRPGQLGL